MRLGNTTMVAGIKLKTALPDPSREAGYVVPNVDLNPLANAKFKSGPPSDDAQFLSSRLNDILLSTAVIDHTRLVIEPRKAVWVAYVDVTCINYDGNGFDAALLAVIAALKNTQLPHATYDFDHDKVVAGDSNTPFPLNKLIVPSSFGFYGGKLVADLTDFEQSLSEAQVTVVITDKGSIAHMSSQGQSLGSSIDDSTQLIAAAINTAKERYTTISKLIS